MVPGVLRAVREVAHFDQVRDLWRSPGAAVPDVVAIGGVKPSRPMDRQFEALDLGGWGKY
jgi:hypothetical protein